MAIVNVRTLIIDTIEDESLVEFHKACANTDKLFDVMERTTDPDKAYGMCVAWCNSVLNLARLEVRLLAAVLPIYQDELKELVYKISPLVARRDEARGAVREFRGPDHDVRPLAMKNDPNRAKDIAAARQNARDVSIQVLAELRPIQEDAGELERDIGKMKLMLRALNVFMTTHFPIPQREPSLRGQSTNPSGVDPIEAFATKYVANMEHRNKADAQVSAIQRARAHPLNKYNANGELVH